ncbi:MAG: hypothetical protein AB1782_05255 [Cyanobacteriota bacterium]
MENEPDYVKYIYKKYKNLSIPYGTIGKVILFIKHPITNKLIVDFGKYGKAVVPSSAVELIS